MGYISADESAFRRSGVPAHRSCRASGRRARTRTVLSISVAGATAATACRRRARRLAARRRGRSGRRRRALARGRCRRRRRCARGRRTRAARTATEIGHIPPRTLELEPRRSHLLAKRVLAAFRALGERIIAHFLQHILGETTCFATISIDRHGTFRRKKARKALNYNRFTRLSGFVQPHMGPQRPKIKMGR